MSKGLGGKSIQGRAACGCGDTRCVQSQVNAEPSRSLMMVVMPRADIEGNHGAQDVLPACCGAYRNFQNPRDCTGVIWLQF